MASDRAGDNRDSFYDDIPNDSSATDNQLHQVDFLRHDLPQPYWPFIQPRERYILLEKHYLGEVKLLEDVMGRRLTPTEQEGIAYWSNKELQLRSRGSTLGVIGGACTY